MASLRPWVSYAARRWRTTSLLAVLVLGTLAYGVVGDRGHDPQWSRLLDDVESVAVSEDGGVVFAVTRPAGGARTLAAHDRDGRALWEHPLGNLETFTGTGDGWIAVALGAQPSRLLVLAGEDGSVLLDTTFEGTPRALAAGGRTVAVALQAPDNAVEVWERMDHARTLRLGGFVNAVDVHSGVVAAGTSDGRILVDHRGEIVADLDVGLAVYGLRLGANGTRLVAGGFGLAPGDLSGGLVVVDLDLEARTAEPRWRAHTENGVGVVDVSDDGSRVLALEEAPERTVLRVTPGEGGDSWRHRAEGVVARQGTTGNAGARLSPDGAGIAVATLAGDVQWLDIETQTVAWSWRAKGGTVVAFPGTDGRTFAANAQLSPRQGYDQLVLFDVGGEPFVRDMARLVPVLVLAELVLGALVLGVGRLRELRA